MRGACRARRVARAVRGALPGIPGGVLVLAYHRAADLAEDPWRLAVTPRHLAEHLDILARHTRTLTAHQVVRALDARVPPRAVAVTFDDGYAELATEVRPLLDRTGVAATMYVVSGAVDAGREFWWDALERVFLGPGVLPDLLDLPLGDDRLRVPTGPPGPADRVPSAPRPEGAATPGWRAWQPPRSQRQRAFLEVYRRLRVLLPDARASAMDALLDWAGIEASPRPSHRTLTGGELAALAADPLIEIGAHTVTHPSLTSIPADLRKVEIEGSRASLEERIGAEVGTFAYPHGGPADVDAATIALVRQAGFASAFVSRPGRARAASDRHAIPRVFVEDQDGDGFARLLWRSAGIRVA